MIVSRARILSEAARCAVLKPTASQEDIVNEVAHLTGATEDSVREVLADEPQEQSAHE